MHSKKLSVLKFFIRVKCFYLVNLNNKHMKISKHAVPSVAYTLTVENEIIDQADASQPLTFLFGVGQMIPGFEKNIEGLAQGDKFEFTIEPAEGYGETAQEAIVTLPKSVFMVDGKIADDILFEGNILPMQDQNGNPLEGVIIEISENEVVMDFNHQLAGKTLTFTGEIVEVRAADASEIEHGHVHGPNGHHH